MSQNERIVQLEKRMAEVEKVLAERAMIIDNLWKIILQIDADLAPARIYGPGLLPKDLEGK